MKKLLIVVLGVLFLSACQTKDSSVNLEFKLPHHEWAATPPMGWNSWDCFGPTVVEDEVKANADYMAQYLKESGWEYIVVDIRWYVENDKAGGYNQDDPIYEMDEYGRYSPAVNRFPSAANGNGFKSLAEYVHSKGLKFGIHLMRGIPVIAVEQNISILGTDVKAQDIYSPVGQCGWLRDNYTVDSQKEGAQEYYNSVFQLIASWGVDYIKVDDLSGRFPEIEMIRKAIDNTGRPMLLSLSPGGNQPADAEFLMNNANVWRTTGDFWDNWPQLKPQFNTCASWVGLSGPGYWPDADMLPLGRIGIRAERGEPRNSGFAKDEQYTLMSLFSIFRSPLMFGGDLPSNDEFTLSLLTNKDVMEVNQHSTNNKQLFRENDLIAWTADDPRTGDKYLALFNAADQNPFEESKAVWKSDLITGDTPGQSVDIDIDISGARKLYLVATYDDVGPRSSHNCDWIEPKLVIGNTTVNLTDLEWVQASAGRGEPVLNETARGGKLTVDGKEYTNGISANAQSIIEYDLPEGVTRFTAMAGLDNGAMSGRFPGMGPQDPGQARRVRPNTAKFLIFVEDPAGPVPPAYTEIKVDLTELGIDGKCTVKDLWSGEKLGKFTGEFAQEIPNHGAGLYRLSF